MNKPIDFDALQNAWVVVELELGLNGVVRDEKTYRQALAVMNALIDEIRDNETHSLAGLLHYIGNQISLWEGELI